MSDSTTETTGTFALDFSTTPSPERRAAAER